jgi:predicted HicB family RNase H-like nuclease
VSTEEGRIQFTISLRVSEARLVRQAAWDAGKSRNAYVRDVLLEAVKQTPARPMKQGTAA